MTLPFFRQPQRSGRARIGGAAILLVVGGALALASESWRAGAAFALGGLGGALLYATGFAYVASWRDAIVRRDVAGVEAQIVMLGASVILFAAALGRGAAFGTPLVGAVEPFGIAVVLGGALFGLGAAWIEGGLCLAVAGIAAVAGAWLAGLVSGLWAALPSFGPVTLPDLVRWKGAAPIQIGVLILLWTFARVWAGTAARSPVRPLVAPALSLAMVGWGVLLVTGEPWRLVPLAVSWRTDLAVALGAVAVAVLAGGATSQVPSRLALYTALAGGLVSGIGAGIGGSAVWGLIGNVASASLVGWLWLAAAFVGFMAGLKSRAWILR